VARILPDPFVWIDKERGEVFRFHDRGAMKRQAPQHSRGEFGELSNDVIGRITAQR